MQYIFFDSAHLNWAWSHYFYWFCYIPSGAELYVNATLSMFDSFVAVCVSASREQDGINKDIQFLAPSSSSMEKKRTHIFLRNLQQIWSDPPGILPKPSIWSNRRSSEVAHVTTAHQLI